MHLLHLEDTTTDAELIQATLHSRWPESTITTVATREAFEAAVREGDFDLILSDYTLPGYDGLSALAFARGCRPDKPFVYISGTIGEERAIQALKAGASDYVIKDRPARLIPAIEAALTQSKQEEARRLAEERIHEQAALLDKANEAICVTNADGRVTYWNASAERLYGWTAAEALGANLRTLLYAGDSTCFDTAYAVVLGNGEWRGELQPFPRSGESVLVESFWSLVTNRGGMAKSILIIDADITEKKRVESQLRDTQRLETLGMLAGGIAHDLNNVLAPILSCVGVLHDRAVCPKDRDMLEIVETSAQHGTDLVRQLLAFARGKSEQRDVFSVDSLMGSVRLLLQSSMPASIEVRVSVPAELWSVHADATQLRQVLLNLCINARDAMPDGGVMEISAEDVQVETGSASLSGEAKAGSYVRMSVADTGTGIPPEIVGKIFDPFFSTKKAGKGTGLGLMNVVEIVKSHGGFLNLETTPGVGTTFHVYLPALTSAAAGNSSPVAPRLAVHGHGEHILVIEDDDGIRTVLEIILNTRGYRVTTASDGHEGLEHLRTQPDEFALVITDINMPGISGIEVVRALGTVAGGAPVLVLSGGTLPDELREIGAESTRIEFLNKPFTNDGLLGTVRRLLDGSLVASAV